MAGKLNDLRTPSFGSPRLDPAFELSAQSEFVDGSTLYDSLKQQPRMLFNSDSDNQSRGRLSSFAGSRDRLLSKGRESTPLEVSFQNDDVIGVAHRPKRFASNRTPELHDTQPTPTSNVAESEADMITRQRLVSQKLLGKKPSKGPPGVQQEAGQLTEHLLSSQSPPPSKASFSNTNWQADQILMSQPELTSAPATGPQPARQEFTPVGPGAFSHPNPQLLQNLLMAQMQQQQLHPIYWPYLQAHQYAPVHTSQSSTHQYTPPFPPWPAPSAPTHFNNATRPSFKAPPNQPETELRSTSTTKWEPASKEGNSDTGEEGAPLEALSDLVAKERASQELIAELRSALEEERQSKQIAENKNRGLEEALAGARSRERELEDQVVEAVDRARRFEEEGRQAKHRLKEAEKEREAARRKMQDDAEKLVRLERKDVRLAAEIEEIQARDQAELEALLEERRRLDGDLTELRKLPVVTELLREDNEALRARLQRAEKDRANLQELVGGFRQSTAELEQASKRANGENEALRKECNMLKLQIASKDTSISQLQVALFAGREERTDLYHNLRKLEEAAHAMEGSAAPSRRGSFGLKSYNPQGESLSAARRLEASFDSLSFGPDSFDKVGLETGSETQGGPADMGRLGGESSSMAAPEPVPLISKTERNANPKHRENGPGPETLPPAGVFSPVGRNRAQQLAGDDMRRSLTMDQETDRGAVSGSRQAERIPAGSERSPAASGKVPTSNERAGPANARTASPSERNALGGERNGGRADGPDFGRGVSGSEMRTMDRRHVAEPPESSRGQAPTVRKESPDRFATQSRDRPNSPQRTVTPPRSATAERIVASGADRRHGPVDSPESEVLSSQPSLGSARDPPRAREVVPFATEQSLREAMEETAAIESKLMEVSLERSQLESEYAKLPQSAGRTMTERRRKQELEGRIEDLTKKIGWLRMELRERHVLHN
ncbi:hypothetical protein KFL_003080110 [Klebsormidium nitens]|uniref:Uncharacterized protein n=1 Tax=Klebsormidium nitens TaxID=105231 RepID=A0A1Y1I717_KLENI|nr:hypothetical protein KFL_003080110 [Klebsormidium nitens]|eukprot:GAQ86740.1 hypothetical protein KFL_003080110 [Klebsormidium nitens]